MDMIPDIYPMGAKEDEKRLETAWTSEKYIGERKHDGQRYLLRHELDDNVHVTSRQESKKTGRPVDKTENVPHLVELMKKAPRGTIIDGEIITHIGCTSSEVTEIMGCDADKAIARQEKQGYVQFVAYDILYLLGASQMEQNQMSRKSALIHVIDNYIGENDYIIPSEYRECDKHDIHAWYEEIVESGGEGIMLKNRDAVYQPDKKPVDTWIKVKKYITEDVVIMGFLPAEVEYTGKETKKKDGVWNFWQDMDGEKFLSKLTIEEARKTGLVPVTRYHYNGWIGSVVFGQYNSDGKLVEVGSMSGMDDELRAFLTDNQESSIGRVVEIKAMERIKKTLALRHPVWKHWREDKNPEDCIIETR